MPHTEIYPRTRRLAECRGCRKRIEFAQVVKSGKVMPFDAPLEPISTHQRDTVGGHVEIWVVDLAKSHFGSCPKARQFSKKTGARG